VERSSHGNRRSARLARSGLGAMELTRSDEGTLHGQLYRTLARMIADGDVKVGDRMPTEAELSERYTVSRTTARRALDELRRASLVERRPGLGTFVVPPKLNAMIPHLHSITAEIEQLGYRAGSRLLSVEEGVVDENARAHLHLAEGDHVLRVLRLRTANERPFYVAESVLNLALFPELRTVDFAVPDLSMYAAFERVTGRRVERVTQWLSAASASAEIARHMEVRRGAPVLRLERVLFIEGDRPIESVNAFFHGETYKYYSESTASFARS